MGAQKTYSLILGIVLLIVGVWGFFTNSILGLFGVNSMHSVLHLIAAVCGIYVGLKGTGMTYTAIIGWIGIILGVLGFIPGVKDFLMNMLNVDMGITVLHLVIGIVSLIVHYAFKSSSGGMPGGM